MKATELRFGNLVLAKCQDDEYYFEQTIIVGIFDDKIHHEAIGITNPLWENDLINIKPIPLTEEWLLKFGFSVITENSAGKIYGYVIKNVFSSDLKFTFWKTTKEAGKIFRGYLELKSVHQLQNLYFALTGEELTIN